MAFPKSLTTIHRFFSNTHRNPARTPAQIIKDAQELSIAECRKAFGKEAEDIISGEVTAASIFELANTKRVEKVPAEGSKTDKVLKWAVSFAKSVDAFSKIVDVYIGNVPEVAGLVWGGCKILLQVPGFFFAPSHHILIGMEHC